MTVFVTVFGIVQGVGYRPFVAAMAKQYGITGVVRNSGGIVEIVASGEEQKVNDFLQCLRRERPNGAQLLKISTKPMPEQVFDKFDIVKSNMDINDGDETPIIPPDLPMCGECQKELYAPGNRRFHYPFISCASCGPRYSIMDTLPYDRNTTTMQDFTMCPSCEREYQSGRRCHAQTISCHDCGPQLLLCTGGNTFEKEEALNRGISMLQEGAVLAVKGVGGYQFICSPCNAEAVEQLRLLKEREKKPFAVMFPSVKSIRGLCEVSVEEEKLLLSAARPIVLLNKKSNVFCEGVSGESRFLGAFLPSMGLHQLLTDACGPLVVTSGNISSEPILFKDSDIFELDTPYLSGILYHIRRILTPLDDSVARIINGVPQLIRRSRGYVPLPIMLEQHAEKPVLAMGGDLKSCFCLMKGGRAYLSQYFGDLENFQVSGNYKYGLMHMERILRISPQRIACDLHPGYQSSALGERIAKQLSVKPVKIQHHHAHAASVMAEHGLNGCIGVIFDGTGYGTDGTVWGGEFLLCRGTKFKRRGHLSPILFCGGDMVSKDAALAADCYRFAEGVRDGDERFQYIKAALEHHVNTLESSSMGRLFDAVSALLGVKKENSYEGECAIALENAAAAAKAAGKEPYAFHFQLSQNGIGEIEANQVDFIHQLLHAVSNGEEKGRLALGFHQALSKMVLEVCRKIREESGETRVALSGGVFANLLLLQDCCDKLKADGFKVFLNSAVPANDGGICLGQAWLCAQMENTQAEL